MKPEDKRSRLRAALAAPRPAIAIGAHDAMSGLLVESYGFDAVWVSGLGVSAMGFGIPDLNLITMTEALDAARRIDAVTALPVIADCDNGFGAFSNVVRTVREYERSGISAICVEDNAFPKRNSLHPADARRDLVPMAEQARRLRAAKEAQESLSFVLIARVEALIAGLGAAEACARADAYVEAGADAILIHSRDKTLREIEEFLARWKGVGRVPLVAVPTLFPAFTAEELHARGFQLVIFANQLMRASVHAMEDCLGRLRDERRPAAADPFVTPVRHIFDLVKTDETIQREEAGSAGAATDLASSPRPVAPAVPLRAARTPRRRRLRA